MDNFDNRKLSTDGTKSEDELSFFDVLKFARRHSFALLGGALIGSVLGLAVTFVLSAQWEAVVLLQVAQTGGGGAVEPPLRVAERIGQESFREDAVRHMGGSQGEANLKAGKSFGSIKVKLEKSDLVGVRVRDATPEGAARFADAVVAEVARVHAKMSEPTIDRWRKELDEIDRGLKQANSEAEQVSHFLSEPGRSINDNNLYRAVLASNTLLAREVNLRALRERKRALQEQLSPERTFPSAPFGRIEISKQPVFPSKVFFVVAGLLVGSLMGVLLSVLRHVSRRRNAQINTN